MAGFLGGFTQKKTHRFFGCPPKKTHRVFWVCTRVSEPWLERCAGGGQVVGAAKVGSQSAGHVE